MKHTKSILMAAVAVLSIASASAQETIYITGSTAFRSAANGALLSLYGANLAATDKSTTTDASAGNFLFTNCGVGGSIVNIAVAWSGSDAGMQTVASGTNSKRLPFFDLAKLQGLGGSFPKVSMAGGSMSTLAINANTSLQKGSIGFADTFQGASVFNVGVAPDGATYNALTFTPVGVCPFNYEASVGFPYTDITTSVACDLVEKGFTTLNVFSGVGSQTNQKVWSFGRNPDSGTRITTLMVAKYGAQTPVLQFTPTVGSGTNAGKITALVKSIAGTINGISIATGNNGESSGGTLSAYLTNGLNANVTVPIGFTRGASNYAITYAGVSDVKTVQPKGVVALSFNGVKGRLYDPATATTSLDEGYTNIITGRYPFWCYEHITYDPIYATAGVSNVVTALANYIIALPSTSSVIAPNIALGDMLVKRSKDGGAIQPK
ncbi:MAG: hypothetical protein K8R38_01780 [Verrucomicrobia bacterium]|nr:hypothetical protein [Verrucomicrobiota bacterium]